MGFQGRSLAGPGVSCRLLRPEESCMKHGVAFSCSLPHETSSRKKYHQETWLGSSAEEDASILKAFLQEIESFSTSSSSAPSWASQGSGPRGSQHHRHPNGANPAAISVPRSSA